MTPRATASGTPRADRWTSWPTMLVGCFGLALIAAFVLPRGLAYDPYSWLIWGREIAHGHLDTRHAATAVKPLPIFVNIFVAVAGSHAPDVWMVIARAATLLSLALAFRLGRSLGGPIAGVVAAVGLAISDEYLGYLFMRGMSEPMAAATFLGAIDSYVRGRHKWTVGWLVLAGLLRPEAWPFLILYVGWLAYSKGWLRAAFWAGVSVIVPLSWFLIDVVGAHQFFRSANAATHQSQGGPLLAREPGLATFKETWNLFSPPIEILFGVGLIAAVVAWRKGDEQRRTTAWLGFAAIAWVVIDAILAQGRFATGAPRYLVPGEALACIVAGVFVADVLHAIARRAPQRQALIAAGLTIVAVGGLFGPRIVETAHQLNGGGHEGQRNADIKTNLISAISLAGGRAAIIRCGGTLTTQNFQVPLVAWQLNVPIQVLSIIPAAHGVVLQQSGSPRVPAAYKSNYRFVGTIGARGANWTVLTSCPPVSTP